LVDSYNPGWIIGAAREIGSRSYQLISFIVIAFAFIVLGLLEVDIARKNIEHLNSSKTSTVIVGDRRRYCRKISEVHGRADHDEPFDWRRCMELRAGCRHRVGHRMGRDRLRLELSRLLARLLRRFFRHFLRLSNPDHGRFVLLCLCA
jgi:hypothetical protein